MSSAGLTLRKISLDYDRILAERRKIRSDLAWLDYTEKPTTPDSMRRSPERNASRRRELNRRDAELFASQLELANAIRALATIYVSGSLDR